MITRYTNFEEPVEEYIDLIPTLEELMIDEDVFLGDIVGVEVNYDVCEWS